MTGADCRRPRRCLGCCNIGTMLVNNHDHQKKKNKLLITILELFRFGFSFCICFGCDFFFAKWTLCSWNDLLWRWSTAAGHYRQIRDETPVVFEGLSFNTEHPLKDKLMWGKTIINQPFENRSYHPFMLILGMVFYCFIMFYPHEKIYGNISSKCLTYP